MHYRGSEWTKLNVLSNAPKKFSSLMWKVPTDLFLTVGDKERKERDELKEEWFGFKYKLGDIFLIQELMS